MNLKKFLKLRRKRLVQLSNEKPEIREETCRNRIFEIDRILGFLDSSKQKQSRDIKHLESKIK